MIKDFEESIKRNEINNAIRIVEEMGDKKCKEAVPFLIEILKNTENHKLRNAIALALSDIGSAEAMVPIVNLISDPKTRGNRGTLLYALRPFDYLEYYEILFRCVLEDNFEVSRTSLNLIEAIIDRLPEEKAQTSMNEISKKIEDLKGKIEFLEEVLEIYS